MKALLVEDDRFYRNRVAEALADFGIESVQVTTLEDAVHLPLETFDILIADVMLPNDPSKSGISQEDSRGGYLSGLCLARLVQKRNKDCKIVFFTAAESADLVAEWAASNNASFIRKDQGYDELKKLLRAVHPDGAKEKTTIFIVHGHDDKALLELKDFLQHTLELPKPIVLREQANGGRTILEKFEDYAQSIDVVFVLVTPDDVGRKVISDDERRRARQNVIFELGFFFGSIGRSTGKIIVLSRGDVELPSDIHGIVWISIEHGVLAAGEDIRRELKALGLA